MEFQLGADVRQREGQKLGELQGVVMEMATNQVMALVVQHGGIDSRDVLLTIRKVAGDDGDGNVIYADVTQEEFDRLRDFTEQTVVALHPMASAPDQTDPDALLGAGLMPVGAATGIESISYTPMIEETYNTRPEDVVIDRATIVTATDGEIGKVASVQVDDESRRIQSFIAHRGLFFAHDAVVTIDEIAGFQPQEILLRVEGRALESLER